MANQFIVVFLGICSILEMPISGNPDARRIVMPVLDGTQSSGGHPIPLHRGFIMFPEAAYVTSTGGWLKPPVVVKNGQRLGFYFLDGDEITLSHVSKPTTATSHKKNVFHLKKVCPKFVMDPKFVTPTDPNAVRAHFDATYGTLKIRRMFAGMRATELTMQSDQPNLVITATSYRNGTSRSVTVSGGEIWIGNMTDSFFMTPSRPSPPGPAHPHFLAYYLMSTPPTTCKWVPSETKSKKGDKDLTISCSNSAYP